MDILDTQGAEMSNSDILFSWGKGRLIHKQAQFNSPTQGWEGPRDSAHPTPPSIFCAVLSRPLWQATIHTPPVMERSLPP